MSPLHAVSKLLTSKRNDVWGLGISKVEHAKFILKKRSRASFILSEVETGTGKA